MKHFTVIARHRSGAWCLGQVKAERFYLAKRRLVRRGLTHFCTVRGWNSHQFNQELVDKIRQRAGDVDAVGADVRYLTRRSFLRRYGISAAD